MIFITFETGDKNVENRKKPGLCWFSGQQNAWNGKDEWKSDNYYNLHEL